MNILKLLYFSMAQNEKSDLRADMIKSELAGILQKKNPEIALSNILSDKYRVDPFSISYFTNKEYNFEDDDLYYEFKNTFFLEFEKIIKYEELLFNKMKEEVINDLKRKIVLSNFPEFDDINNLEKYFLLSFLNYEELLHSELTFFDEKIKEIFDDLQYKDSKLKRQRSLFNNSREN
ncbi:uncharacterized protein VNE69_04050 [Vairimorpha necatrix]|uniref:Uncharacterized protein n=1 Tax=Vairimorpha necatrix TaxID=6039 RepID=A0AAX4JBB2_9MICR